LWCAVVLLHCWMAEPKPTGGSRRFGSWRRGSTGGGRSGGHEGDLPGDYDLARYGPPPPRFVAGCGGNMPEAARRWIATFTWREAEGIDTLLTSRQPFFRDIKSHYPHYLYGKTRGGSFVYVERPGLASIPALLKKPGVSMEAVVRHYTFISEYLWNWLDRRQDGKLVSVWDVTGVGMHDLVGDTLTLLRATMKVMQNHYPERTEKLFIINAPSWFTAVWRIISPMVDVNTRRKITILGSKYHQELNGYIGPENVPVIFGGSNPTPLEESDVEKELGRYVDCINSGEDPYPEATAAAAAAAKEPSMPTAAPEASVSQPVDAALSGQGAEDASSLGLSVAVEGSSNGTARSTSAPTGSAGGAVMAGRNGPDASLAPTPGGEGVVGADDSPELEELEELD